MSWELQYRKSYLNLSTSVITDYYTYNYKPLVFRDSLKYSVQYQLNIKGEKTIIIIRQLTIRLKPQGIINYLD